jgi:hypothetical protein
MLRAASSPTILILRDAAKKPLLRIRDRGVAKRLSGGFSSW